MIRRLLWVAILVLIIVAAFRCLAASEKSNVTMVLTEKPRVILSN